MEWLEIVQTSGITTVITTLIVFFITRFYNKKDSNEKITKKKKNEAEDSHQKAHKEISEFISIEENKISNIEKEVGDIKLMMDKSDDMMMIFARSLQTLLRDRIIQMYNFYYLDDNKKFLPIYMRESLDDMYKEYKSLGGNGVVENFIEKLYSLPTKPEYDEN